MRLLHTPTLRLESKRDDDIPPYAILSHTWGQDCEEITLQDLRALLAAQEKNPNDWATNYLAQRPGFTKIQGAAKLALSEGYQYIWIDTCCIDKTSSAELSEAINSMFRWCEQSDVCYVFLSDIDDPMMPHRPENTIAQLGHSRWFTRGWTLQELIAPTDLKFFSKGWAFLGSRNSESFLQNISAITGIDRDALGGSYELENFSVSARMKWASHRQTSRPEDMAYCLMGIFQVNMPLLYGEGSKAFIRLQEEILRANDDQTLFTWTCPKDDPLSNQASGLLAKSPLWFRDAAHFKPLSVNSDVSKSSPSSMTNAGLYIRLSLINLDELNVEPSRDGISEGVLVAILNCGPYTRADEKDATIYKVALRLQHLGGDRYVRVECDRVFDMDVILLKQSPVAADEYIYVKQNPVIPLPDISIDDRGLLSISQLQYRISPVWSIKGQWDAHLKRLRCNRPDLKGVLCIFRYTITYPGFFQWSTDVMVGLHPGTFKVGPQSCWCVQKPALESETKTGRHMSNNDPHFSSRLLSNVHKYNGVVARIRLEDEDKKYKVLTLNLVPLDPWTVTIPEKSVHLILPSNKWFDQNHTKTFLKSCTSVKTQPDRFSVEEYDSKNIRVETSRTAESTAAKKIKSDLIATKWNEIMTRKSGATGSTPQNQWVPRLIKGSMQGRIEKFESIMQDSNVSSVMTSLSLHGPMWTDGFHLIHWAVISGHKEIVRLVLHYDRTFRTRFQIAQPRTTVLKDYCATKWLTAVHLAVIMGEVPILELLLQNMERDWANVLPNTSNALESGLHPKDSPMHLAASYLRSPAVERAFDSLKGVIQHYDPAAKSNWVNVDRNSFGETPLHRAAAMNNSDALLAILARVSNTQDIEPRDSMNRTPLWHAAAADAYDTLLILLSRSADVNSADANAMTALQIACRSANSQVTEALLSHGANPNLCTMIQTAPGATTAVRMTPCIYAALRGSSTTLCALLNSGAEVNTPEDRVLNPLHVAAANGHLQFVKVLCEMQGINKARKMVNLSTPYLLRTVNEGTYVKVQIFEPGHEKRAQELAEMCGHVETARYLQGLREGTGQTRH